jgi:hypothetical protein
MNAQRARSNSVRLAYLGSWLVFVAVILVLEGWTIEVPLYFFIAVLGFVGVVTGALWALRDAKWVYGALGSSVMLLAAYALWWSADISHRYSVDPDPGLWGAAVAQLEIWLSMVRAFIGRSYYLYAFCQLYWGVLMALLQLVFLPSLLISLKATRSASTNALMA